jgi:hypothetical protein
VLPAFGDEGEPLIVTATSVFVALTTRDDAVELLLVESGSLFVAVADVV